MVYRRVFISVYQHLPDPTVEPSPNNFARPIHKRCKGIWREK